jgi:hypothetical protein
MSVVASCIMLLSLMSDKSSTSFHFPLHNVTYLIDRTFVVEQIYDDSLPVNRVLEEDIVVASLVIRILIQVLSP